jgi:hypothetical protein
LRVETLPSRTFQTCECCVYLGGLKVVVLRDLYRSVGRAKHQRVMAGTEDVDILIGKRAQELRGLLKIKYPMEHGIVTDWEDMEKIWQYVYAEELKTVPEEVRLEAEAWKTRTFSLIYYSFDSIPFFSQKLP